MLITFKNTFIATSRHVRKYRLNLHDLEFCNGFLEMTPKSQETKEKKMTSSKLKTFCIKRHCQESEKTSHRMKEHICKSHI